MELEKRRVTEGDMLLRGGGGREVFGERGGDVQCSWSLCHTLFVPQDPANCIRQAYGQCLTTVSLPYL